MYKAVYAAAVALDIWQSQWHYSADQIDMPYRSHLAEPYDENVKRVRVPVIEGAQ